MAVMRETYDNTVKACLQLYADSFSMSGYSLMNEAREKLFQIYSINQSSESDTSDEKDYRHLKLVQAYHEVEECMTTYDNEYSTRARMRKGFIEFMNENAEKTEESLKSRFGASIHGEEDIDKIFRELYDIKEILETTSAFNIPDISDRMIKVRTQLIHVLS